MRGRVSFIEGVALVALAAGVLGCGSSTSTTGTSGVPGSTAGSTAPGTTAPPAFTTTTVDVGGTSVSLSCAGSGPKTVVFVGGIGEDGAQGWGASTVPQRIAAKTRACVYDRPGLGASGPATTDRTVPAQANELHALVQAGALPGPLVLVGQGYGTFIARWYAKEHVKDVAGMVLLDPPLDTVPTIPPPDATAGQLAEYAALGDLNDNLGAYGAGALPPPPAPSIVLGVDDLPALPAPVPNGAPTTVAASPDASAPMDAARRRELQQQLAKKSPFGTFEHVKGSGTYIQYWQPQAVVDAIVKVLDDKHAPGK